MNIHSILLFIQRTAFTLYCLQDCCLSKEIALGKNRKKTERILIREIYAGLNALSRWTIVQTNYSKVLFYSDNPHNLHWFRKTFHNIYSKNSFCLFDTWIQIFLSWNHLELWFTNKKVRVTAPSKRTTTQVTLLHL